MKQFPWWENQFIIKQSSWISDFFNPLFSLLIFFAYYGFQYFNYSMALREFLPLLIILILPLFFWIFWNVKTGRYTNKDVSNRNQRHSLYGVILVLFLVYFAFKYFVQNIVDERMLYLFILLIIMQLSNYFIKTSMHTALNFFVAALFWKESVLLGIIWIFISILVGITRVILKRHRISEVLMGFFLTMFVSILYICVDIFKI